MGTALQTPIGSPRMSPDFPLPDTRNVESLATNVWGTSAFHVLINGSRARYSSTWVLKISDPNRWGARLSPLRSRKRPIGTLDLYALRAPTNAGWPVATVGRYAEISKRCVLLSKYRTPSTTVSKNSRPRIIISPLTLAGICRGGLHAGKLSYRSIRYTHVRKSCLTARW